MKSVRYVGLSAAALFSVGGVLSLFSLTDLSLFVLSFGLLAALLVVQNMEARRAMKSRRAEQRIALILDSATRALDELAAQQKSIGLVYRELRSLRGAVLETDSLSIEQSERQLAVALRALDAAKREIHEQVSSDARTRDVAVNE